MEKIKVIRKEKISEDCIHYEIDREMGISFLVFRKSSEFKKNGWVISVTDFDTLNRKLIVFIENVLRGLNSR